MTSVATVLVGTLVTGLSVFTMVGETARIGGGGGRRTIRMECGANAVIIGVGVSGARDGVVGFNLIRKIRFVCQPYDGTTFGTTATNTVEAVADKSGGTNKSSGFGLCPQGTRIATMEVRAGTFVDRVVHFGCYAPSGSPTYVSLNVGGDGGTVQMLSCPSGQLLYRVDARVGDAIDSLKGYCRTH